MALSTPEMSLGTGLAVGVVAYGVFQAHLPCVADVRTVDSNNRDVHASVKSAAWQSAAAVAAISLIAKDATVFIIGGAITLALTWTYHHANAVSPITGRATGGMTAADVIGSQQMSMPQYDAVI